MDAIFQAVDLSSVAAFVAAVGILLIGIAMAFKGIDLAKRAIDYLDENRHYIKDEDRAYDGYEEEFNSDEGYKQYLKDNGY